jgi:hypothetical protein
MTQFNRFLVRAAAAAAIVAPGLAVTTSAAHAQAYGPPIWRCNGDSCAPFRCDYDGDHCRRVGHWRDRDDYVRPNGYDYVPRGDGYHSYRRQCDNWNRCVTLRCDPDGDDCHAVGD